MQQIQRSSDIVEIHSERAISYGLGGAAGWVFAGVLFYYHGSTSMFVPLASVIALFSSCAILYGIYCALQVRKVTSVSIACPYCHGTNRLVETPDDDFSCSECHRMIPIFEQRPMPVFQVRCGFCNELNYYSAKTDILLCESCNHEIPISQDEDHRRGKATASRFAVVDDDSLYELVLVSYGNKTEQLIGCLQQMLALNRNQVKQMLGELPVVLLTGISRRKAEMLKAQLAVHEGLTEMHAISAAR